ncbi:MAG: glycerate kinase, partial [Ginsengibacter sp.]
IKKGAKKILLGIGGSATNDAGTGILYAMGFRFFDKEQNELKPIGANLIRVNKIAIPETLSKINIEIACDVTNPMYGPEGAAYIFAPQKGASTSQVAQLDDGLKNFASVLKNIVDKDFSAIPGAGAAGAIPPGLMALLDAQIIKGTELIINASHIKDVVKNANLIITGEGKLDHQSLSGKTISAIARIGTENGIPVVAVCGRLALTEAQYKKAGVALAFQIKEENISEEESINNAFDLLAKKVQTMMIALEKIVRNNGAA